MNGYVTCVRLNRNKLSAAQTMVAASWVRRSPRYRVRRSPPTDLAHVLNIPEGAGEFSPDDKKRFYRIARRSATESAAILHVIARREQGPEKDIHAARALLARVVSMLVRMSHR